MMTAVVVMMMTMVSETVLGNDLSFPFLFPPPV